VKGALEVRDGGWVLAGQELEPTALEFFLEFREDVACF
jgi:hypothetical protein